VSIDMQNLTAQAPRLKILGPGSTNISADYAIDRARLGTLERPVEIRLPAECAYVGTVRDSTGTPVAGAVLDPIDLEFRREQLDSATMRTDSGGRFEIRHLAVGQYIWTVNANGFKPHGSEIHFATEGQVIREDIVLGDCPPDVALHLRSRDRSGKPVCGVFAWIDMVYPGQGGEQAVVSFGDMESIPQLDRTGDAKGLLCGSNLAEQPNARYYLMVKRRGFATHVEEIPLSDLLGKEQWSHEVVLDVAHVLVGHVIPSKDYYPVVSDPTDKWDATLKIKRIAPQGEYAWEDGFTTEPGGDFKIDWLPDGEYRVLEPLSNFDATLRVPHEAPLTIDLEQGTIR